MIPLNNAILGLAFGAGFLTAHPPFSYRQQRVKTQQMTNWTDVAAKCSFFPEQSGQNSNTEQNQHIDAHTLWNTMDGKRMDAKNKNHDIKQSDSPSRLQKLSWPALQTNLPCKTRNYFHRTNGTPMSSDKDSKDYNQRPPIRPDYQIG
jgi:hypothetical protein